MCGSRKFCQRGTPLTTIYSFILLFLVWWGEEWSKYHYKRAINGPPAKRHLNGVSLAGRWWSNIECWIGSFVVLRGSGPVLLRNPLFLYFPGGSRPPVPLWIRTWMKSHYRNKHCFLMLKGPSSQTMALKKPLDHLRTYHIQLRRLLKLLKFLIQHIYPSNVYWHRTTNALIRQRGCAV